MSSLEVAATTLATFLSDHQFSAAYYLFTFPIQCCNWFCHWFSQLHFQFSINPNPNRNCDLWLWPSNLSHKGSRWTSMPNI